LDNRAGVNNSKSLHWFDGFPSVDDDGVVSRGTGFLLGGGGVVFVGDEMESICFRLAGE